MFADADDVGQCRRAVGAGGHEQVGETFHHDAQRRTPACFPFLVDGVAALPDHVEGDQRTRQAVVAGGQDQHVEFGLAGCSANAALGDFDDGVRDAVHQVHVRQVVGLVVAGVQAGPARKNGVALGLEGFGRLRVGDHFGDLAAHKFSHVLVGFFVDHQVAEGAQHGEAALLPGVFQQGLALLGRHAEEGACRLRPRAAHRAVACRLTDARVVAFDFVDVVRFERHVAHRHGEARRALEHKELARMGADVLHDLDAGGAGADHTHTQAGKRDRLMRPARCVQQAALEFFDAGNVRHLGHRQRARGHDTERCFVAVAAIGLDCPQLALFVPDRAGDAGLELEVLAQVETGSHEIDVTQQLGLGRKLLGPGPFLFDFRREGIAVVDAGQVDAGTGVAIPVPDAAEVTAGLETLDLHAHFAELVGGIHAAEAATDDHHIQTNGRLGAGLRCFLVAHGLSLKIKFDETVYLSTGKC